MIDSLLNSINEVYELSPATDAPASFSASGMDFTAVRYVAKGLGNVSVMQAAGMGGMMKMLSLVVNPFFADAPLLSIDRISAMGQEMMHLEMFNTTLSDGFDISCLEQIEQKYVYLPGQDKGEHWYDDMRVGTPLIKKVGASDASALNNSALEYLKTYLIACKAAPKCDLSLKLEKARVYSEGLLSNGGPATDPVKASIGEKATAELFRRTLFGTDDDLWEDETMPEESKLDIEHFKTFWIEQQKTAKHMEREQALKHIIGFIENHNTCALATGTGDFVRCTPIEYTYMDGEFYLYSEGGDKFIGLEKNLNVSLAIFEYYGDKNDSHGLQVAGKATLYPPRCELFKKVLAFKGIPYDVIKAAKVDVALIRITPKVYEMYDTDFVKAGYDVRQIVRFEEEN